MYLRFRYRLGFETLCAEVTDSLSWRRLCRIGPYDAVPNPSTLMKITTRCGEQVVAGLNAALLEKADAAKLIRLDKVRLEPRDFVPSGAPPRTTWRARIGAPLTVIFGSDQSAIQLGTDMRRRLTD
jgi:IS5 family transposase